MMQEYFLNYEECDSKEIFMNYFIRMEKLLQPKLENSSPYVSGDFERNIFSFLNSKNMQEEERCAEDVIEEISTYFHGATRWHHPYVMSNIKTPVNLVSLSAAFHAMLIDPNLAGDTNCGQLAYTELEVIKYISDLVGWDWKIAGGYFTFGGSSTILNAVKMGINKAVDNACDKGISNLELFVISSEQGHSAHADACNWTGIGKENCIRVPVTPTYQMDISIAEEIIEENILKGKSLAAIIACGGTTIQMLVDSIDEIYQMRERIVKKYELTYKPHIHVDAVVGWLWLFYKSYSFTENKLNLSNSVKDKVKEMANLISKSYYADSIGIDFHKSGFCPYASSLILTNDRKNIFALNNKKASCLEDLVYGDYAPSVYTLELSRSSTGPLTALTALKLFGITGYQKLLREIMEGVQYLIDGLNEMEEFEVINSSTNGTCILFYIKCKNHDIKYEHLAKAPEEVVRQVAVYNYRFYLFVLKNIQEKRIDFFIDYSSGYEKIRDGFHMGVLKMQTFNPMLQHSIVLSLIDRIAQLKQEYDKTNGSFDVTPVYKPKGIKLTHENKKVEFSRGELW